MLAYLTAQAARDRLIATGTYTNETAPSLDLLEIGLEDIEAYVDGWLGYRAAATQYIETLSTNHKGLALLPNYPVISVESVRLGKDDSGVILSAANVNRLVQTGMASAIVRITYVAGYDPIPKEISRAVWQLLLAVIKKGSIGGDLNWLNEAPQELSSISLPGGLTKSFRSAGGGSSRNTAPLQTQLDQLLISINRYRRTVIT